MAYDQIREDSLFAPYRLSFGTLVKKNLFGQPSDVDVAINVALMEAYQKVSNHEHYLNTGDPVIHQRDVKKDVSRKAVAKYAYTNHIFSKEALKGVGELSSEFTPSARQGRITLQELHVGLLQPIWEDRYFGPNPNQKYKGY